MTETEVFFVIWYRIVCVCVFICLVTYSTLNFLLAIHTPTHPHPHTSTLLGRYTEGALPENRRHQEGHAHWSAVWELPRCVTSSLSPPCSSSISLYWTVTLCVFGHLLKGGLMCCWIMIINTLPRSILCWNCTRIVVGGFGPGVVCIFMSCHVGFIAKVVVTQSALFRMVFSVFHCTVGVTAEHNYMCDLRFRYVTFFLRLPIITDLTLSVSCSFDT